MKKIISVVLIAILLLSAMPFTAYAGGDEIELSLDTPYEVWVGENTEIYRFTPTDDGWYRFYTDGDWDTYATLYNSNWDQIVWADDLYYEKNFSLTYKLYSGYTYYLAVGAYVEGLQLARFNLYATETVGVEEAFISKEPDNKTCIIGLENESIDLSGLEVTFTLSDGEEVLWYYDTYEDVANTFVTVNIDDDGSGHYYVEVECGEGYDKMYFDMIENPVESISVDSMSAIEIYENSNGYFAEDYYHYSYQIPLETTMLIKYKDGTEEVVDYYGETADGFYFMSDSDQYNNHWIIGENEFTIEYMGCTTTATVTVLPCPYKNVTLITPPSKAYVYGDFQTGYFAHGDYFIYPYDLTGLEFEVEYSDGTTEIIDDDNIDMDNMEIDGYPYQINEQQIDGPTDLYVTLNYKGADINYYVEVVETPVESIEVVKAPNVAVYEDAYYADYLGMKVKVNYKDGTNDTVTFTNDNMEFIIGGSLYCRVPIGDNYLYVDRSFDIMTEEYYTSISCLGVLLNYDGIVYTESREIESIIKVENFSQNTDGMTVYIEYRDGQEETLTYSVLDYYDYGDDMYEGFAMTKNGIAYFDTSKQSEDENTTIYRLYTLGKYHYVECSKGILGDANQDGIISIADATAIQKYIADIATLSETGLKFADVDGNGLVNIADATAIQKYLAGLETGYAIGETI